MFSPESTTESEMSSAESIMTPKTSFLSDLEFCQATDKITHE